MLEPYQRAALIPNEAGVAWHHFLAARFIGALPQSGRDASLAVVVQFIEQQSQEYAEVRGLLETSTGSSLPVVAEFTGMLRLDTREISLHGSKPEMAYVGQISENGRVMMLRQAGQTKQIHLVHEETLTQFL